MTLQDDRFTPEGVDEQVDLLAQQNAQVYESLTPATRLVRDLQTIYAEDERLLERVGERLAAHLTSASVTGAEKSPLDFQSLRQDKGRRWHFQSTPLANKQGVRLPGLLAAVLVAALVVGSVLWMFSSVHRQSAGMPATDAGHPAITKGPAKGPSSLDLYAAGGDGVYRLDAKTGKVIWHYVIKDDSNANSAVRLANIVESSVVSGKFVYAVSSKGKLYALNAANGSFLWAHAFDVTIESISLLDGRLYVPVMASNSKLFATYVLNAADGSVLHKYQGVRGRIFAGMIYDAEQGYISAFNPLDGRKVWLAQLDQQKTYHISGVVDGVLYATSNSIQQGDSGPANEVYALDTRTGKQLWQSHQINVIPLSVKVMKGVVYVGTDDSRFCAFDARTGKQLWEAKTSGIVNVPPEIVGDTIYVAHTIIQIGRPVAGGITALNAADRSVRWERKVFDTRYNVVSLNVQDGVIYAGGAGIYALRASDGTVLWKQDAGNLRFDALMVQGS
ncbi:hypothetical protein EPA93_38460 [Ktedonosporobacter rubrisoli]|uniref:Pyrrolo-quinoline quinone repeat domain-containing protein n=1 Tax=Ktedonosporobacter rubrisoli TaxID=2509675 RepID=A0A4P6K1I7_KTERU|nr:PQQ-binding-like beta-propeller repeat protein [Ktedonosporobacter rubrisoli]QBD81540.1 hypothetical protein EPA93_38460 [Ktedonosporobacter rubrisoli]